MIRIIILMKVLNQYLRHQIDRQLGSMNIVKDQPKKKNARNAGGKKDLQSFGRVAAIGRRFRILLDIHIYNEKVAQKKRG